MDYKIVCTDQVPVNQPQTHAHIVSVGIDTNQDGLAEERQSKEEVIRNINNGVDRYYTIGERSGRVAFVEVVYCAVCRSEIIKSRPDSVIDNNLDHIRRCNWNN